MTTPTRDAFFMPGEWAPHERCWMAWPCRRETWSVDGGLERARTAYATVARAISPFEPVTMVARPEDAEEARSVLGPAATVLEAPLSDSWMRDIGPSYVVNGKGGIAGVHWGFNAWGGNYDACDEDRDVARRILEREGVERRVAPLVMEGGSFHVDGEGTLITTEQCLLNPNRNPGLPRNEIEEALRLHLGVRTIIWLGQGYEEDETDGHIDEILTYIRPGLVMTVTTDDPADPNHAIFNDNIARLRAARDARGRELEVATVPIPARREDRGVRLTLSHTNLYIANGGVVMPAFDDPTDGMAESVVRALFPDRRVVRVPAMDIVRGGGGIHCITQQRPTI